MTLLQNCHLILVVFRPHPLILVNGTLRNRSHSSNELSVTKPLRTGTRGLAHEMFDTSIHVFKFENTKRSFPIYDLKFRKKAADQIGVIAEHICILTLPCGVHVCVCL